MTPIILTDPKALVPTFYKLFHQRSICAGCGKVYAHSHVRAFVAVGDRFAAVDCNGTADIQYHLPVQVQTMNDTRQPFCHECYRPGALDHLPTPTPEAQRALVGSAFPLPTTAAKPKKPTTPTKPTTPKPTKKPFTVDDI